MLFRSNSKNDIRQWADQRRVDVFGGQGLQLGQLGLQRGGLWHLNSKNDIRQWIGAPPQLLQEAQAVRAELAARGVRSVYLSDKDSVFAAQEAHDLLAWLKACAEPDVERPLRAALACVTLNLSLPELERLNQDELAWETRVMQFRGSDAPVPPVTGSG